MDCFASLAMTRERISGRTSSYRQRRCRSVGWAKRSVPTMEDGGHGASAPLTTLWFLEGEDGTVGLSSLRGAEATKQSMSQQVARWIASRSLSSGAHSRDPLARNDEGKNQRTNVVLPPAAVQPEPLLRMFADPAFDHGVDGLRRALHVDAAVGVAHGRDFLRQLGAKAMTGQTDHAHAMHGTFDLPQQAGERRIGPRLAAEEGDLDAAGPILIDQHGDVSAIPERFSEPQRRAAAGRNQRAHLDLSHLLDDAVGAGDVGTAVEDRGVQMVSHGGERGQLPVRQMAREDQRRLAVPPQLPEQLHRARRNHDAAV